jgi:predicted nucleotidyltransferase
MQRDDVLKILADHRGELRQQFGVKLLTLFGSVARNTATETSDIDLLVAFARPVGLFGLYALQDRAFNMYGDVAAPNLYAVAQQNCLQAPATRRTVMGQRSGSSSSNDDVERAGPARLSRTTPWLRCRHRHARHFEATYTRAGVSGEH